MHVVTSGRAPPLAFRSLSFGIARGQTEAGCIARRADVDDGAKVT